MTEERSLNVMVDYQSRDMDTHDSFAIMMIRCRVTPGFRLSGLSDKLDPSSQPMYLVLFTALTRPVHLSDQSSDHLDVDLLRHKTIITISLYILTYQSTFNGTFTVRSRSIKDI
jgi:hypothetical protein